MEDPQAIARIQRKYRSLLPEMDERRRRQWAAAEARELGWGGISLVARATGLSRPTITAGTRELDQPDTQRAAQAARVRRPGVADSAGVAPGARHARPSRVAAPLDLQEH